MPSLSNVWSYIKITEIVIYTICLYKSFPLVLHFSVNEGLSKPTVVSYHNMMIKADISKIIRYTELQQKT